MIRNSLNASEIGRGARRRGIEREGKRERRETFFGVIWRRRKWSVISRNGGLVWSRRTDRAGKGRRREGVIFLSSLMSGLMLAGDYV